MRINQLNSVKNATKSTTVDIEVEKNQTKI